MSCDDYIPERDNDYPKFDCIDHFVTHYQLRDLIDDWFHDKIDTDIDIYDSETEELVYSFRKTRASLGNPNPDIYSVSPCAIYPRD